MRQKQRYPVGIDLGTTFSSLAYVDESGRVEALRLPDGRFEIASAVYFKSDTEVIVGNEALKFALIDADRVARAFKRRMGDPNWSFAIGNHPYRPEELSAMVLKKLIDTAREKLGPIDQVVISVPFIFDEARRRATQDAGRIVGVEVLDIVDEPVAAAMAYGHALLQAKGGGFYGEGELDGIFADQVVLVYDLGGGTFDLTLIRLHSRTSDETANDDDERAAERSGPNDRRDRTFDVIATDGEPELGGENWDAVLADYLADSYDSCTGHNPRHDKELMQELRLKAEEAKKSLSERSKTAVLVNHDGKEHVIEITRGDFERITEHLIVRTEETLKAMLEKHGMTLGVIDRILIVGGSSRMPKVLKMLENTTGRPIDMSLPPDTAVAKGAALYAAQRSGHPSMKGIQVKTVNPHPLGLVVKDLKTGKRINQVLLKANEAMLTKAERRYKLTPGKGVMLVVVQGDLPDPDDCVLLGKRHLMPPAEFARGLIDVEFCFQENGLLQVEGVLHAPGRQPTRSSFEIHVEGTMTEPEIIDATEHLPGISIE